MKTRLFGVAYFGLIVLCAFGGPTNDFQLFREGETLVWDSSGHEKAKGIRMKISYPRTWKASEGSRPNIVQKFASDGGLGKEMVMILTRALPKEFDRELTEKEKQELFSRDSVKQFLPDGGRFISHKFTKVDGEVCAMVESEHVTERVGLKIGQKSLTFVIPHGNAVVLIHCLTGGNASAGFETINKQYNGAKGLFLLISSSCVLTKKWKTP